MNAETIIDDALLRTHTDSDDYNPLVEWIRHLNLVYGKVVDKITEVTKWDYFWDLWVSDTVIWQSEYEADKLWIDPDALDIKKINKVFIKYKSTDTYPTKVRYQNPGILDYHPNYYKDNQSKSDPFFYIQDKSIFIYPAPTEALVEWLEIYVIHSPADLLITSTEDEIEIPRQFHEVLVLGLMIYIYHTQGKINEANALEWKYKSELNDMVAFMKQRYNQPMRKTLSSLTEFR